MNDFELQSLGSQSLSVFFYWQSAKHFLTGLFPFFTFGKIYI